MGGAYKDTPGISEFETPVARTERPGRGDDQLQARKIDGFRRGEVQYRIAGRLQSPQQRYLQLRRGAQIEFATGLDIRRSAGFLKPYVHTIGRSK